MKLDPITAARQIAEASLREPLTDFDRTLVGEESVRLLLPLRDPEHLRHHLKLLQRTIHDCIAIVEQSGRNPRGVLLDVRGRMRDVNRQINVYRRIRR